MDSRTLSLWAALGLLSLSPGMMMAAEEDSQAPDLALLEFLGSWDDADGEWIDPLQMLDALEVELEAKEGAPAQPPEAKDTEVENHD